MTKAYITPKKLKIHIGQIGLWVDACRSPAGNITFQHTVGAGHYGKGSNTWALIWEIDESGAALAHVYTQYKNETNQKYYVSIFSSLREKLKAVKDNADAAFKVKQEMDSVSTLVLARQKVWIESYISRYPSSKAGAYLFNQYYHLSPNRSLSYLDSIINRFSGLAKSSVY